MKYALFFFFLLAAVRYLTICQLHLTRLIQGVVISQSCTDEFIIKNGNNVALRIDSNDNVHACGVNVCNQLQSLSSLSTVFVRLGTDECFASGVVQKIPLNITDVDTQSEWNRSGLKFVAKQSGIYQVAGQCWYHSLEANSRGRVLIYKNSAMAMDGMARSSDEVNDVVASATFITELNANDEVDLRCSFIVGSSSCVAGGRRTYLSVVQLR